MTYGEVARAVLVVVALYALVRGTFLLRRGWRTLPSDIRLLWLVMLTTCAAGAFAHANGLALGIPLSSGGYASALPLLLAAALVSLPRRFRL